MLTIRYSARFKKDYKIIKKRGYDARLFEEVLGILPAEQP
jgi:mRNA interferase YafQ